MLVVEELDANGIRFVEARKRHLAPLLPECRHSTYRQSGDGVERAGEMWALTDAVRAQHRCSVDAVLIQPGTTWLVELFHVIEVPRRQKFKQGGEVQGFI